MEMSLDIEKFKEIQRLLIQRDKQRLELIIQNKVKHIENEEVKRQTLDCERGIQPHEDRALEEEDFLKIIDQPQLIPNSLNQNVSVEERLNLSCNEGSLEKKKQSFIDRLINSENPLTFRSDDSDYTMLRYGEYSPNNPHLRVSTAPYLGLGEYEQRKQILAKQRQADYKDHINQRNERIRSTAINISESRPVSTGNSKSVQTDIQNIHNKLIQYNLQVDNSNSAESSPESANSNKENRGIHSNTSSNVQRIDQRLTTIQNDLSNMDKPRSILSNRRTETPRDHLLSEYNNHGYVPSCLDGFSYHDKYDEIQRERLKREAYQLELRNQIEEKRRLSEIRQEQERREQERENRRLEQQLMRMQEEQIREEQRRAIREEQSRRNSEDFHRRKQDLQMRSGYRKRLESENSTLSLRNTNVASKLSHYSPPVSRRNTHSYTIPSSSSSHPDTSSRYCMNRYDTSFSRRDALNRMDLLNIHDTHDTHRDYSRFSRFDSLSRIDSLKQDTLNRIETLSINDSLDRVQRRHSATQQDLSMIRRSPKMQRRSSSSRLDDPLPLPVLKAHSPVARELKNSIAINSSRLTPDSMRRLEDKWQIPAIQKNMINHGDLLSEGHGRSILTQLGAIRMQLQKEQLRMDETLRQRGNLQTKAVNFH